MVRRSRRACRCSASRTASGSFRLHWTMSARTRPRRCGGLSRSRGGDVGAVVAEGSLCVLSAGLLAASDRSSPRAASDSGADIAAGGSSFAGPGASTLTVSTNPVSSCAFAREALRSPNESGPRLRAAARRRANPPSCEPPPPCDLGSPHRSWRCPRDDVCHFARKTERFVDGVGGCCLASRQFA